MKDFWAEGLQNHRKGKIKKVILLIIVLLIFIALMALISIYFMNYEFRQWCDEKVLRKEILQEDTVMIEIDNSDDVQVWAYDKYICILKKQKLELYNKVRI